MPFQVVDNQKWIKDLLDQYDNKTLSREQLIEAIDESNFEMYKMGYEQKGEDLANDEITSKAQFDSAKQEWFKTGTDMNIEGEVDYYPPKAFEVVTGTPRQGEGIRTNLRGCSCTICDGLVPGRTDCREGVDKI